MIGKTQPTMCDMKFFIMVAFDLFLAVNRCQPVFQSHISWQNSLQRKSSLKGKKCNIAEKNCSNW